MARKITDKEMRVLRFIYDYIKSNDSAPAMKEIAKALSIDLNTAYYRIHPLCGQDYLTRPTTWWYKRTLALTEKSILACEGEE